MSSNIIPDSLSEKEKAFIYLLAKEKTISKILFRYKEDMEEKNKKIESLNRKLQKRFCIEPRYATTKEAASYIGTDTSFLTKRQGKVFKLGTHFFKPEGESIVRWDLLALAKWLTSQPKDTNIKDFELDSLLKRR